MFFFNYENPNEHFTAIKSTKKSNIFNYQVLPDINAIDLQNKKTLVVLCGNDTKDEIKAAKYSYYFFDWIKNNPKIENIDSYSIFYKNGQPLFPNLDKNFEFDYKGLTDILFSKLIFTEQGEKLPIEQITQNFGNTIFFAHSVGGMIMNELMYHLQKILEINQFSATEIKNIFSSIVLVAYSPYKLVDFPINSIYITPFYDSIGSTRKAFSKLLSSRNIESTIPREELKFITKRSSYYEEFIDFCLNKLKMETPVVISNKNTIDFSPDLLYYDGSKEDHNLAGVIKYQKGLSYKTQAGNDATEFIERVFNYCLDTPRRNFNVKDIEEFTKKPESQKTN